MDIFTVEEPWWKGKYARLAIALLASAYFFYYTSTAAEWHFIDNVNLLIHEAGHWIFLPFGTFLHIAGGSLFQTIFPMIYVGYFYMRRDFFSASLLLFWVGQNVINVSVYASDAILMQLPLLGGDTSTHDWHAMLSMLGWLPYTHAIGLMLFSTGFLIICMATFLSVLHSQSKY